MQIEESAAGSGSSVQDLLALVYFGSLFDGKPQSEFIANMAMEVAGPHARRASAAVHLPRPPPQRAAFTGRSQLRSCAAGEKYISISEI